MRPDIHLMQILIKKKRASLKTCALSYRFIMESKKRDPYILQCVKGSVPRIHHECILNYKKKLFLSVR